jgi:hypothetical protein
MATMTRASAYTSGTSWEAYKDDMSALYCCDARWMGGRFVIWTLEADSPQGLIKKRGGYFDSETGVFFYGSH